MVAGGKAVICCGIVDHESEDSIELLHAEGAPSDKCLKHNFGVARRPKAVTQALELSTQFAMIVDLAIHDDRFTGSRIDNRLPCLIPVHDG